MGSTNNGWLDFVIFTVGAALGIEGLRQVSKKSKKKAEEKKRQEEKKHEDKR